MPARVVICPVDVTVDDNGERRRTPRVGNIPDPGRPPVEVVVPSSTDRDGNLVPGEMVTVTPTYTFSAAISDGLPGQVNDTCLCLVAGVDMSGLDADPEVESLFETADDQLLDEQRNWLANTPKTLGWKAGKLNKIKGKLNKEGVTTSDLTDDNPLHDYCNRVAAKYSPGWDIRRAKTTLKGA